ncbi:MAG: ferrous iron transporter B, partial [Acidobacteria bacterium]
QLTGVRVLASNYPGSTVAFTEGCTRLGDLPARVIDAPGTYSLSSPSSPAEEVVVRMLEDADLVVNVVHATALERSLHLTLEILDLGKPTVVALNMWDEAHHKGITIDVGELEREIGAPVVPTVAIAGEGLKTLKERLQNAPPPSATGRVTTEAERWATIGRITSRVQTLEHRHHTFLEWLGDCSVRTSTGLPIAILVLAASFLGIRLVGEVAEGYLAAPVFEQLYRPVTERISNALGQAGLVHQVLIGKLIHGRIDFLQSFGLLTTGLYVPLAIVLPFVLAFYFWLGILEDLGYLPRLAVLLDRVMHRVGLHGWAVIPNLLGLGCNVPGILSTRVLEDRRARLIASTLVSVAVPCGSLQAMIWALVGSPERGGGVRYVLVVYGTLLGFWFLIGRVLTMILPGTTPDLLLEIPPYRRPHWPTVFRNLGLRVEGFLKEGIPVVLLGVLLVNLLYWLGFFDTLARIAAPLMTQALGLPAETFAAVAVGFLRKEMAMGLLATMDLTIKQLVVASTLLSMFFPCVATFVVLARELGWRHLGISILVMLVASLAAGSILNLLM